MEYGLDVEAKVQFIYPTPIADLPVTYATNVRVGGTADETFLDFAQIQPQTNDPTENSVQAVVSTRVILTVRHTERLIAALTEALQKSADIARAQPKALQ